MTAHHPQGLVFAVAATAGVIKLYDVRSYDKGPFDTFNVSLVDGCTFRSTVLL